MKKTAKQFANKMQHEKHLLSIFNKTVQNASKETQDNKQPVSSIHPTPTAKNS